MQPRIISPPFLQYGRLEGENTERIKKKQTDIYKGKQKKRLEEKLTEKRTNRKQLSNQKKGHFAYGHKKRSSAELQPLLTLNLIL